MKSQLCSDAAKRRQARVSISFSEGPSICAFSSSWHPIHKAITDTGTSCAPCKHTTFFWWGRINKVQRIRLRVTFFYFDLEYFRVRQKRASAQSGSLHAALLVQLSLRCNTTPESEAVWEKSDSSLRKETWPMTSVHEEWRTEAKPQNKMAASRRSIRANVWSHVCRVKVHQYRLTGFLRYFSHGICVTNVQNCAALRICVRNKREKGYKYINVYTVYKYTYNTIYCSTP